MRAFLVVLDSLGIGGAPDAHEFFNGSVPDTGANTLGHIAAACAAGQANTGRQGPLEVPHLARLGLFEALRAASGMQIAAQTQAVTGAWGFATERSKGKDTPSGHWELAGLPVPWEWHYFPDETPAFPDDVVSYVCKLADTDDILGKCHGSGTVMLERFGEAHLRTGQPICYTSADSVFQIAAHEERFGEARLQKLCADLSPFLHARRVGRVISRPFTGPAGAFRRTPNRRDYAIRPPAPVLTNWVQDAGRRVIAIGKIGDIFSMAGIDEVHKGPDATLAEHLLNSVETAPKGSLVFANFVEFDSLYGHRRDVAGYARHIEWFDTVLGRVVARLKPDDLLLLTADHGNDPTWVGTDHTRERVPVLAHGRGAASFGAVAFADIAASVAVHLAVPPQGEGRPFW